MTPAVDARFESLREDYWRDGFAVLPGALDRGFVAGLAAASREVWDRAVADPTLSDRLYDRPTATGERVPDRLDPFLDLDPRLTPVISDPAIVEPTAALLGGPLWVMKDKLIPKPPGLDGYGPHQDQAYYEVTGVPADRLVSVLIPLDDFDESAGPLEYAPRSHGELVSAPGRQDPRPEALVGLEWRTMEASAGDLGFLHPQTLHRSGPNRSAGPRSMVFLTYGTGPGGEDAGAVLRSAYLGGMKALIDAGGSGHLNQ